MRVQEFTCSWRGYHDSLLSHCVQAGSITYTVPKQSIVIVYRREHGTVNNLKATGVNNWNILVHSVHTHMQINEDSTLISVSYPKIGCLNTIWLGSHVCRMPVAAHNPAIWCYTEEDGFHFESGLSMFFPPVVSGNFFPLVIAVFFLRFQDSGFIIMCTMYRYMYNEIRIWMPSLRQ